MATVPFPNVVKKVPLHRPTTLRVVEKSDAKFILLAAVFFTLSAKASGGNPPIEHFVPASKGTLFEDADYLEYLLSVRKTLIEPITVKGRPIIQVALLEGDFPNPESVLTLYDAAKDNEFGVGEEGGPYILEYRITKEILWGRKKLGLVGFEGHQIDIAPELAKRMFRLWHSELAKTRTPPPGRIQAVIGMHYCFKLGEGSLSGATPWSGGSDRVEMFDRAAMYAGLWAKPGPKSEEYHHRFLQCLDQLERKSKRLTIP